MKANTEGDYDFQLPFEVKMECKGIEIGV